MPPKTRRAAHEEVPSTEHEHATAPAEPKKQKLESEFDTQKREHAQINENKDKETLNGEHGEYAKENSLRAQDTTKKEETTLPKSMTKEAQTKETALKEGESKIFEKGKLVFYYRPKIEVEEVKHANDIQRFTFAMTPEGGKIHRVLVVGSKKFPDKHSRARCFAYVEKVSDSLDEINTLLQPYDYNTKTRGERHQEGSRVAGEALYEIVQHGPNHVHLAYVLDIPEEPTESQAVFSIHKEDAIICMVKNPTAGPSASGARGLEGSQKAEFPPELMEHFKGKVKSSVRFTALQPEFLNYEGCEIIMISSGKDPKTEFKGIMEELEAEAEQLEKEVDKETHHHPSENIYKERHLSQEVNPDATTELK